MEESPFGFILALIISTGVSVASWLFMRYKRLV
jgi:hypothetical protein